MSSPLAPVSWGELIDKITILEIKLERLTTPSALANVRAEHDALVVVRATAPDAPQLASLTEALRAVNLELWEVEDALRDKERAGDFGADFIRLARAVYHTNDRRAALKREINEALGSALVEEKSYAKY